MAIVAQDDEIVGRDRAVGGEGAGHVGAAVDQRFVFQCDVVRAHVAELKSAVDALQARQPVGTAEELLNRRQAQARGDRRELRERFDAFALRDRARRRERLRIVHRGRRQPRQRVAALELASDGCVQRARILHRRKVQHVDERRTGVFRVEVDVAAFHRGHRDLRRPEVEKAADAHSRALERLRVDLRDDETLGEVLRADDDAVVAACRTPPAARRRRAWRARARD